MIEDINSEPLMGDKLLDKILWIIWHRYYPKEDTRHYELLELNKYSVGEELLEKLLKQPRKYKQ